MTPRYREEQEAQVERDPDLCSSTDCMDEARVATPAGPLCRTHADDLADHLARGDD